MVWEGALGRADFDAAMARIHHAIREGELYQVNYTAPLSGQLLQGDAWGFFQALQRAQPGGYGAYIDAGAEQVLSVSPELFFDWRDAPDGGNILARPMKGTAPRGATPEADAAQAARLRTAPKERAENVMIVDLLRNDLGRVCRYGSVKVEAVCRVETYQYVHHLVSEVRGRLREGATAVDLLRAAFPGGSVTGAPKVRAMEIIAELEPTARGPYCGCLGYVGFDGSMDTNLLIRTFTVGRGWVQFPVGGGIVADSVPEAEYAETLHKAEGLLRALA